MCEISSESTQGLENKVAIERKQLKITVYEYLWDSYKKCFEALLLSTSQRTLTFDVTYLDTTAQCPRGVTKVKIINVIFGQDAFLLT